MTWVKELNPNHDKEHCKVFKSHVRCSQEEQIKAVMESRMGHLTLREIADIYKVTPLAVSIWRKKLFGERRAISMEKSLESNKDVEQLLREKSELEEKVKSLENDVYRLQLERDVLEKAGEIPKRKKGINQNDLNHLTNYEKIILLDALRNKYKLNQLLSLLSMSKSSYCYQRNVMQLQINPYS